MMSREEQDKAFQRAQKWQEAFEAMREALQQAGIVINGIPVKQSVCVPGIARIIRAALALADKVSRGH